MCETSDSSEKSQNLILISKSKRRIIKMKATKFRRIFTSIILVLSICLSIIPLTAFTEPIEESEKLGVDCCELASSESEINLSEAQPSEILHIASIHHLPSEF